MNTKLYKVMSIVSFIIGLVAFIFCFMAFSWTQRFFAIIAMFGVFFHLVLCLAGFVGVIKQEKTGELQKSSFLLGLVSSGLLLTSSVILLISHFVGDYHNMIMIVIMIVIILVSGGYFASTLYLVLKKPGKLLVVNNMDAPLSNGELVKIAVSKFFLTLVFAMMFSAIYFECNSFIIRIYQSYCARAGYPGFVNTESYPLLFTIFEYANAAILLVGFIFGIICYVKLIKGKPKTKFFKAAYIIFVVLAFKSGIFVSDTYIFVTAIAFLPIVSTFKTDDTKYVNLSFWRYILIAIAILLIVPIGLISYKYATHLQYYAVDYNTETYKFLTFENYGLDEKFYTLGSTILSSIIPLIVIIYNLLKKKIKKGDLVFSTLFVFVAYIVYALNNAYSLYRIVILNEYSVIGHYGGYGTIHYPPLPGNVETSWIWMIVTGVVLVMCTLGMFIFTKTRKEIVEEKEEQPRTPLEKRSMFAVISKASLFLTMFLCLFVIPIYSDEFGNAFAMVDSFYGSINIQLPHLTTGGLICIFVAAILVCFYILFSGFIQLGDENKSENRILNLILYVSSFIIFIIYSAYINDGKTYFAFRLFNLTAIHFVLILLAVIFCISIDYWPFTLKVLSFANSKIKKIPSKLAKIKESANEKKAKKASEKEEALLAKEQLRREQEAQREKEIEERNRQKQELLLKQQEEKALKEEAAKLKKEQLRKEQELREKEKLEAQKAKQVTAAPANNLSSGDKISQLKELKGLLDSGAITEQEYEELKAEILGRNN